MTRSSHNQHQCFGEKWMLVISAEYHCDIRYYKMW